MRSLTLLTVVGAAAGAEVTRTITGGPEKCRDAERVKPGRQISMHYEGHIDITYKKGVPYEKVASSGAARRRRNPVSGAGPSTRQVRPS